MIEAGALKQLKESLRSDLKRIRAKLGTLKDVEFGDTPGVDNEEADEVEEAANESATVEMLEKRLEDIEIALKKIAEGRYGVCEKCKKEISPELLKADPESRRCKNCKAN